MKLNTRKACLELVDCLLVAVVGIASVVLNHYGNPKVNGFFCSDETIRLPYKDSTVPSNLNSAISYSVPVLVVFTIHWISSGLKCLDRRLLFGIKYIIFGGLCTQLLTQTIKLLTVRLRPHFIDVCGLEMEFSLESCGNLTSPLYVREYRCHGNALMFSTRDDMPTRLMEAHMSFPSGHTSLSTWGMLSAILLLQFRLTIPSLGVQLAQMLCVVYAIFTGISRITDHKHHSTDVMAGALLGAVMATATVHRILVADTNGRFTTGKRGGCRRRLDEMEDEQLIEELARQCDHVDGQESQKPAILTPISAA